MMNHGLLSPKNIIKIALRAVCVLLACFGIGWVFWTLWPATGWLLGLAVACVGVLATIDFAWSPLE